MSEEKPEAPAILYVDDEELARKYFAMTLDATWTVLTAPDVAAAREILGREGDRIGVVVSDQRMPGEQGIDLLAELKRERPAIVRILTTAYADLESAVAAVNDGSVFHYLLKPWNTDALRTLVHAAVDHHRVQRERDQLLHEKLETLKRLVIADRVRSYAVLANGLAQRLRHPMEALKAFFECAPPDALAVDLPGPVRWADLWDLAGRLSADLAEAVGEVIGSTLREEPRLAPGDLRLAVEEGISLAAGDLPELEVAVSAGELPARVRHDRSSVARVVRLLCRRLARNEAGHRLAAELEPAAVYDHPGVRVRLRDTGGEPWDDDRIRACFQVLSADVQPTSRADTDLLAAYFIVYHHAGNLAVNRGAPAGPGFDLLLPEDPAAVALPGVEPGWTDSLFAHPDPGVTFGNP